MESARRHLAAIAGAVLAVQLAVLTLGSLRVCWGIEHTHGGLAAPDCPMHHVDSSSRSRVHHGHGPVADSSGDSAARIDCRCSNDSTSLYVGPRGIIPAPAALRRSARIVMVAPLDAASMTSLDFPPLSPPPRSTPAQRV